MTYEQLLAYLDANWHKTTLGRPVDAYPFDRLRDLLALVGSPQQRGEYVGVTGTKGKGSIARMTAEILRAHGLRVGLFTSPHLVRVEERVQWDGRPMPPDEFARRFGEVLERQRAAGLEDLGLTPVILALALAAFAEQGAEAAVLEVRAGGRFDPTNVAPARTICLGPIGLEHVPGLGYTLADIAWQKSGLVKPGASCFSAHQPPEAAAVVERECAAVGAPLHRIGADLSCRVRGVTEHGQVIDLRTSGREFRDLPLALLGAHQAANAALATAAAERVLHLRGATLEPDRLATALGSVRWPARLERLSDSPLVLYDGAHTPESAEVLARALADHFPARRWTILLGVLRGKDAAAMLGKLGGVAARIRCLPIPGFGYQPPDQLADLARSLGFDAAASPSLAAALDEARSLPEPVCITGTLYLYAEALASLGRQTVAWL